MARRKRRSKKHTSGLLRLKFTFPTKNSTNPVTGGQQTQFIDIAQCLSAASRRFYRQGYAYNIAGFEIISDSDTGTGLCYVSCVPTTWSASGAWQKSFAMWNKMNQQALEIDPSIKPKFYDFKVYADGDHVDAQSAPGNSDGNAVPFEVGFPGTPMPGEWEYSKIMIPNEGAPGVTDQRCLHMVGVDNGTDSVSCIQGYSESRALPFEPDPATLNPSTGWMNRLFDLGDNLEDITNALETDNDELPYDQRYYPGGSTLAPYLQVMTEGVVTPTTIGSETWMNGGLAYCGLLRVDNYFDGASEDAGFNLVVYLQPGSYKGIDAIPMQDVN